MSSTNHEDICTFCCEVAGGSESNLFFDLGIASERDDYILEETSSFVCFPCIGALTEMYILIVSKRHVLSTGWLSSAERAELRVFIEFLRKRLEPKGKSIITFEHGSYSFRDKGGACYDHAHVHMVVTRQSLASFLEALPPEIELSECVDWLAEAAAMITKGSRSYLAIEGDIGDGYIGTSMGAPSQFFRRALARWLGIEGEWDWLVFPRSSVVRSMIEEWRC